MVDSWDGWAEWTDDSLTIVTLGAATSNFFFSLLLAKRVYFSFGWYLCFAVFFASFYMISRRTYFFNFFGWVANGVNGIRIHEERISNLDTFLSPHPPPPLQRLSHPALSTLFDFITNSIFKLCWGKVPAERDGRMHQRQRRRVY
ncbi:hypothetical protein BDD12DRAFT_307917 [Trichophaea hybrida]|nr:hypothetical protein BDD12DRAFT_307917 [Trichophaea hybrida]